MSTTQMDPDISRDREARDREPAPRLLSLRAAARYAGVSYWTIRDYVKAHRIPTVQMPPLRAREGASAKADLRRTLIDRGDLDRFIDALKQG